MVKIRSIIVYMDKRATVLVCKLLLIEVKWLSFMQHLKNIRCPIQHKSSISVWEWGDLYLDIDKLSVRKHASALEFECFFSIFP
jgi:hypothetical protein